jgi:hypothetical protein
MNGLRPLSEKRLSVWEGLNIATAPAMGKEKGAAFAAPFLSVFG